MTVANDLARWRTLRQPLCVAVGFFDGVHRGHAKVLEAALRRAREQGGTAWALTFDPHPARVLHPPAAPRLLTSLPHKLRALARVGIDGCMVLPFTPTLAARSPQDFLDHLVASAPTLTDVFVGPNWRFGQGRAGTPALLARFARQHGFRVHIVRPATRGGAVVSSTRVRAAIHAGELNHAAALLGRPFSVLGRVVHGSRLGRRLGYPTANVAPTNEVLPPFGIYAVFGLVGNHLRAGLLSYGVRPTVHHGPHPPAVLEWYVLDFAGNLYGREVEIFFIAKLRDEQTFDSLDALCAQIARDVAHGRRVLARKKRVKESLCTMASTVL